MLYTKSDVLFLYSASLIKRSSFDIETFHAALGTRVLQSL